jgi:hypothetical protein
MDQATLSWLAIALRRYSQRTWSRVLVRGTTVISEGRERRLARGSYAGPLALRCRVAGKQPTADPLPRSGGRATPASPGETREPNTGVGRLVTSGYPADLGSPAGVMAGMTKVGFYSARVAARRPMTADGKNRGFTCPG